MSDIQDTALQVVDRKELLAQQFDEVEQGAPVTTDKPAAQAQTDGRARDEAGKFVAKEKDTDRFSPTYGKVVSKEKPNTVVAAVLSAPVTAASVETPAWVKAPDSWKKEQRDGWEKLDPRYQQYIHERETQMRAGVDPLLPKAELADKISKVSEPYMNTIRGLGLDLPRAVEGLMKVDHDLRTLPFDQKMQRLIGVARSYGIDLTGQAQQAQQTGDPNVQALQNELLGMKGQFSSFLEQQEAAQQRAAQEEIQKFAKTVEHFEDVKPLMIQLLQGGVAADIQEAYDKAIRLNPELFDSMQAAKQASADAEKRAVADAAAKKAKAAAVSVKSATPGAKTSTNAQDRRSMLSEQIGGLSERL